MSAIHLRNLVGDRLATLPLLVLYLTDGCNSRCAMCDIWRNPRRNMAAALVEQLAADAERLRVRWVVLSGGEAMQHPEWPAIARRFRDAGARVILLTNGLLVRKQADAVIASVDELVISLDAGTPETYQAIRGVDGFAVVLDGIRAARAAGLPVTTRTTVQRANFRELPAVVDAALGAGATRVSFLAVDVSNPYAFGPRFAPDADLPLVASLGPGAPAEHGPPAAALRRDEVEEFEAILDELERAHNAAFADGRLAESPAKLRALAAYFRAVLGDAPFPPGRCNAPHTSAVVEVDGTLRPCYFLPTWARLDGRPLSEALNDSAALALRAAYRRGERRECAGCVCPLYKGPRALLRL